MIKLENDRARWKDGSQFGSAYINSDDKDGAINDGRDKERNRKRLVDAERAMQARSADQSGAQTARAPSPPPTLDSHFDRRPHPPATSRGASAASWSNAPRAVPPATAPAGASSAKDGGTFMTAVDTAFMSGLTPSEREHYLAARHVDDEKVPLDKQDTRERWAVRGKTPERVMARIDDYTSVGDAKVVLGQTRINTDKHAAQAQTQVHTQRHAYAHTREFAVQPSSLPPSHFKTMTNAITRSPKPPSLSCLPPPPSFPGPDALFLSLSLSLTRSLSHAPQAIRQAEHRDADEDWKRRVVAHYSQAGLPFTPPSVKPPMQPVQEGLRASGASKRKLVMGTLRSSIDASERAPERRLLVDEVTRANKEFATTDTVTGRVSDVPPKNRALSSLLRSSRALGDDASPRTPASVSHL